MIYIVLVWILASLGALAPVLLAAWRARKWRLRRGMGYVLAVLCGAAVNAGIAAALSLAAVPVIPPDAHVTAGLVLLTIGYLAQTAPMIAFALYMLGLLGPDVGAQDDGAGTDSAEIARNV